MKTRTACLLTAGVLTGLLLLSTQAMAQIRFLPSSEFDRINMRKPQSVQVKLESMQASNDFERVAGFKQGSRYRRVARPIGRLKIKVRNRKGRTGVALCTAAIISENHILTNNHCIPGSINLTVIAAKIEMDYLDAKNTSMVRSYKVDTEPLETSEELDYSIVRVHGNPSRIYGKITLAQAPPRVQDAVFIIHHPEGAPKTLSRKDCYVGMVSGVNFIHSCDTLGGSSGSPVFSDESFRMIGIHFAGSNEGNYGKQLVAMRRSSRLLESLSVKSRPGDAAPPAASASPPPATGPAPAAPDTASRPRPKPATQQRRPAVEVSLVSDPPGAAIYFHGVLLGVTPHRFMIAPRDMYTFTLKKQGYSDSTVRTRPIGGRINTRVTLRPGAAPQQPGAVAAAPPSALDPATDQMNKALKFWDDMEKSGFLKSRKAKDDGQPMSREDDQINKANSLFKSMGK